MRMSWPMTRWRSYILWGVIALLLVAALWVLTSSTFTPSASDIRSHPHLKPFLVEASDLTGLYGNFDTDARVFRYVTTATEDEFRQQLEERSLAAGWTELPSVGGVRRFERVRGPKGSVGWYSAEEARVRHDPVTKTVTVGWVQADARQRITSFAETHEAEYAKRDVWPRLTD